jgi:tRNA(Ile)-lysidine synthase
MPNLIKKIQNTIFEHNLFPRGSKIIIACSGGPDSTALLDIFSKIRKKYDIELVVAHINYGLRGKDSDKDEKFVRSLAKKYGFNIFALNLKKNSTSENKLRDIRYDFFEKIRQELNFDYIAVGHTLDDQAETFLMRVIRGSGLAGLSSISYKNKNIIRLVLNIPKKELVKYLEKNNLSYRIDKTNLESKFFRNKIRNRLIPYLEKNFNPEIKQTVFDATESIREDYDFISNISRKEFNKNKKLSVKKLLELHPSLQKQVFLLAILEKRGNLKNIESSHIREIIKILKSTKNKPQVVLFQGLKITRKSDNIIMEYSKKLKQ